MKKLMLFNLLCSLFLVASCSSDFEEPNDNPAVSSDSVEVSFSFSGMDVSEKPMGRTLVDNPKTYYHIRVVDPNEGYDLDWNIGYVGLFDDLRLARLRLKRETEYYIYATALVESESRVDVNKLSNISYSGMSGTFEVDFYNKFSDYVGGFPYGSGGFVGATKSPNCTDMSVDRFFKYKSVNVISNETINIELQRFSYKLTCVIDPPSEGYVELSCNAPDFCYRVDCNSERFVKSTIYSLAGTELSKASKVISLKLEHFDSNKSSTSVSTRDITVKPNVETTVNVNYDQFDANNGFNLTFDATPMGNEVVNWK